MKKNTGLFFACILFSALLHAQTASDVVMMQPGEICTDIMYDHNSWDHYWEGDFLRDNGNIGTLSTQVISAGFILGVIKHVDVLIAVPYVITHPDGGTVAGSHGIQDGALMIKYDALEKKLGPGKISFLATAGISTPLTNYFPEEPFAIGPGCTEGSLRGVLQYSFTMGAYAKMHGAYHLRSSTFVDQTYYYTTQAFNTNEVDMPNAFDYAFAAGYVTKNKQFKAEAVFGIFHTLGGFNIRKQDGGFPSNDMEETRIGVNADYFPSFLPKGFAVHAQTNYTLRGLNVGKSLEIGGAVSYQFRVWTPHKKSAE